MTERPGLVVLFGSGETSASGRTVNDWLLRRLQPPIRIAVLETPAGFQPNSALVAERVAQFFRQRLQNYHPQVVVVPARKRGTPFSPDDPTILTPMRDANAFFLGAGSPTYAVRQLKESFAWHYLVARHRRGAAVIMASAATIAGGAFALPVYEIYKVGEDLHWHPGLDLFGSYGISLAIVPHWNNAEGGAELDTSHCFMGRDRFARLLTLLPSNVRVVGIDEHTALVADLEAESCLVMGQGRVTLLDQGREAVFETGETFPIARLGPFRRPRPDEGLPREVWQATEPGQPSAPASDTPSPEVLALVREREAARARRDWSTADALRARVGALGWGIADRMDGPQLTPLSLDRSS